MQHRLHGIARFLGALSTPRSGSPSVGMIAMTAMVAWQVFSRYVLNASPSWTEPASVMVMSWFIFLGAAVGVRENFHMGFDVLVHFLPASAAPLDAGDLRPRGARLRPRHGRSTACSSPSTPGPRSSPCCTCPEASPTCRSSPAAC